MTDLSLSSRSVKVPAQERGERRVAELLRAAEALFVSDGYETTTMSAIAQHAGASIGSLYQFFPNKESIGNALLVTYLNELTALLEEWRRDLPDTPRAFGHALIATAVDYVATRPACSVLAETPAFVPVSQGMDNLERLSASVCQLLSGYTSSIKGAELNSIALAACFMIRAAVQANRIADSKKASAMRKEMQEALGAYLAQRLGESDLDTGSRNLKRKSSPRGKR